MTLTKFTSSTLLSFVMRKVLSILCLALLSTSSLAAIKMERMVDFGENSTELSLEARKTLGEFFALSDDFIVEKVDISSLCEAGELDYYTMKLAQDRSMVVYDFLTQKLPENQSVFEIKMQPFNGNDEGHAKADCVRITAYFVEKEGPFLVDPPRALFPEEFKEETLPASMTARKNGDEMRFTLNNILFEGNSAIYLDESESTLLDVAQYLLDHPEYDILLEGHVNGHMGKKYLKRAAKSNPEKVAYKNGKHLSLARAESIRDFLVMQGVSEDRITCEGKGGTDKIYKDPKNRKENEANRRIEIILIKR